MAHSSHVCTIRFVDDCISSRLLRERKGRIVEEGSLETEQGKAMRLLHARMCWGLRLPALPRGYLGACFTMPLALPLP